MSKEKKFDEYDFLDLFYQEMLTTGQSSNLVRFTVNARMVETVYDNSKKLVTENELKKFADVCLANDWLKHTTMGVGKYGNLQLTTVGLGVVKSKQKQKELSNNKSTLKKVSDYIEDHKGLFVFLGFVIALVGLLIKLYGG